MSEPRDVMRGPVLVAMCECGHDRHAHIPVRFPKVARPCTCPVQRDDDGRVTARCPCEDFAYSEFHSERVSKQLLEHGLEVQRRMYTDDA